MTLWGVLESFGLRITIPAELGELYVENSDESFCPLKLKRYFSDISSGESKFDREKAYLLDIMNEIQAKGENPVIIIEEDHYNSYTMCIVEE